MAPCNDSPVDHPRRGAEPWPRFVPQAAALVLAWAVSAGAAPLLQYEATLGLLHAEIREGLPVSVTAGADGSICVTDATTQSGHVFDGRDVHVFSTGRITGLGDPEDIAVDASGGFVCTDSRPEGGRTIRRLDFFGQPQAYEPERPLDLWQPEHLLLTRDGNYLTTDASNELIAKHDVQTGALLWKRAVADFRSSELIAIGKPAEAPDGSLYLPLPGDRHVVVLSAEGEYQTSFGQPGAARGRLSFPVGVAFCPDGSIAVLDRMRHTILVYDVGRQFISEYGVFGMGPTELYYPTAIAATADGRIYVVQGFEGRIHEFRFIASRSAVSTTSRAWLSVAGRGGRSDRSRREGGV